MKPKMNCKRRKKVSNRPRCQIWIFLKYSINALWKDILDIFIMFLSFRILVNGKKTQQAFLFFFHDIETS